MRLHRFYLSEPLGDTVSSKNTNLIHQLANVFRYREGSQVIMWNEIQGEAIYDIVSISKKEVSFKLHKHMGLRPKLPSKTLVIALIKKDSLETAIKMAVEMGVTDIYFVTTARSQSFAVNEERLEKIILEACEQSLRTEIPAYTLQVSLAEFVESNDCTGFIFGALREVREETRKRDNKKLIDRSTSQAKVIIGPEGGFTEEEEEILEKTGAKPVTLGQTVMRAETATVALLTYASVLAGQYCAE